mmetsp:Transcript_21862/g.61939  ORF Transcript_21862/g.61939 Transcript_21862/m.61939 type:complete len:224 (-) Transcript_21862:17-688(-)
MRVSRRGYEKCPSASTSYNPTNPTLSYTPASLGAGGRCPHPAMAPSVANTVANSTALASADLPRARGVDRFIWLRGHHSAASHTGRSPARPRTRRRRASPAPSCSRCRSRCSRCRSRPCPRGTESNRGASARAPVASAAASTFSAAGGRASSRPPAPRRPSYPRPSYRRTSPHRRRRPPPWPTRTPGRPYPAGRRRLRRGRRRAPGRPGRCCSQASRPSQDAR